MSDFLRTACRIPGGEREFVSKYKGPGPSQSDQTLQNQICAINHSQLIPDKETLQ